MQLALQIFERSLTAERVGVTFAIEIDFEAKDPDLASEVANAVANAYIDEQRAQNMVLRRARAIGSKSESRSCGPRRGRSKSGGRIQERAQYRRNRYGQLIDDQRVTELSAKLNAARDDTLKAKARLDQLAAINGTEVPSSIAIELNGKTSDILDKLVSQQFEVASKEADYSVKYGPNNPAIISLRKQKAELQSEIMDEVQRLKENEQK